MFKNFSKLIRLGQWYKNLLIFLPLVFAPSQTHSWPLLILGFFGFSCVSSITYIINDWIDREKDRKHPLKKHRPLASGAIKGEAALIVSLLLLIVVLIAGIELSFFYASLLGVYFILTNAYSFKLKHIPILDILLISFNFILRTLAGLKHAPNLTTIPYFLAVFALIIMMVTHKRRGDLEIMKEKAFNHKPVLKYYTSNRTNALISVAWCLIMISSYFIGKNSFPIIVVLVITNYLFYKKPVLAVSPKLLLKEWFWNITVIGAIIYLVIS